MFGLCFAVRRLTFTTWFICPILTAFTYYHFAFVDYDGTATSIYFASIIGMGLSYFILVMTSEVWLFSSLVYVPLFVYYLYKTSGSLVEVQILDLGLRCIFAAFIYVGIAYKVEHMTKQAFLGKESFDKSFNRWLKIFETFPEGIAMLRNDDHIQYANGSLKRLLDLESPVSANENNSNYSSVGVKYSEKQGDTLKSLLEATKIRQYQNDKGKPTSAQRQRDSSVWDFLMRNEKGATFEIKQTPNLSKQNSLRSQPNKEAQERDSNSLQPPLSNPTANDTSNSSSSQKFVSLNQVVVNIAGRTEKLFIVRDVTHTIYLDHLIQTKEQMQEFTQSMMENIDDSIKFTQSTLRDLEPYVQPGARTFVDDLTNEMKKSRYSIRDYRDVYDISENDFFEPAHRRVDVRASLREAQNAASNDICKNEVEVMVNIHDSTPAYVAADQDLFVQCMINLIQQSVAALGGPGYIKMNACEKTIQQVPNLVIDLIASEFHFDKQMAVNTRNMTLERAFRKIMAAEVDMFIRIAKVISNQLGWRIEFNWVSEGRYSLYIPLVHALSDPDFEDDHALVEEEKTTQYNSRTPLTGGRPVYSKQTNRDRIISYEQLDDSMDHGVQRPFSAQVPELGGTQYKHGFQVVKEQPEMEDQAHSPTVTSTKSFRFKDCCASCLLMNSTDIQYFQDNLGLKCDEAFLEKEALAKIQKSHSGCVKQGCAPYRYFVIDLDETSRKTNLKWLIPQVKELLSKQTTGPKKPGMKIFAFASKDDPALKKECKEVDITFVVKPRSVEALRQILRDKDVNVKNTQVTMNDETEYSPKT